LLDASARHLAPLDLDALWCVLKRDVEDVALDGVEHIQPRRAGRDAERQLTDDAALADLGLAAQDDEALGQNLADAPTLFDGLHRVELVAAVDVVHVPAGDVAAQLLGRLAQLLVGNGAHFDALCSQSLKSSPGTSLITDLTAATPAYRSATCSKALSPAA